MSDDKNKDHPINNEGHTNQQGQPVYYNPYYPPVPPQGEQGQPMYYPYMPYPPTPPQENGEQASQPMYIPYYPPMPPPQGEQGQPAYYPYMPYPPTPPQENGEQASQPMYIPYYPPMPPPQGEQGQSMYYPYMPYPPMPPQENGEQVSQPANMPYSPPAQQPEGQQGPKPSNMPYYPPASQEQGERQEPKPENMPYSPPQQEPKPENIPYYPPMAQNEQGNMISNDHSAKTSFADFINTDARQDAADAVYENETKEEFDSTVDIQAEPRSNISFEVQSSSEDNSADKAFVNVTPIYDTLDNDSVIKLEETDEKQIFSSTTPIIDLAEEKPVSDYDFARFEDVSDAPSDDEELEDDAQAEAEIPAQPQADSVGESQTDLSEQERPAVTANNFLASMQSFYSSMGFQPKTEESNAAEAPVSGDESLGTTDGEPKFTSPAEDLTSEDYCEELPFVSAPAVEDTPPVFSSASDFLEQPEFDSGPEPAFQAESPALAEPEAFEPKSADPRRFEVRIEEEPASEEPQPAEIYDDKGKDRQYWEFMNQLLDRFDDGKADSLSTVQEEPIVTEPNAPRPPVKEVQEDAVKKLANFGKNVGKPQRENKFFRKSSDDLALTDENGSALLTPKQDQEPEAEAFVPQSPKMPQPPQSPTRVKKQKAPKAPKAEKAAKAPKQAKPVKEGAAQKQKGFKGVLSAIFPVKGDSTKEIVRKVVLIVSVLVLISCVGYFGKVLYDKSENASDTKELATMLETAEKDPDDWSEIHKRHPDTTFPSTMLKKYADLYAINQDLVGWISIDELGISYPVVQRDNDTYYLKRNFNDEKSIYGSIEMSSANDIETLDLNTVIYGHTMTRDDQMFTKLDTYKTLDGYKKAPLIEMGTIYSDYYWKVYAVFITNGTATGDQDGYIFNYVFNNLPDVKTFAEYIDQINQRTLYDTNESILPTDRILTLSTCTHDFDEARLVVVARMVRDGESKEVDTSKAKYNQNPRYPQAYYNKKGIANPYKDYVQWDPFD